MLHHRNTVIAEKLRDLRFTAAIIQQLRDSDFNRLFFARGKALKTLDLLEDSQILSCLIFPTVTSITFESKRSESPGRYK